MEMMFCYKQLQTRTHLKKKVTKKTKYVLFSEKIHYFFLCFHFSYCYFILYFDNHSFHSHNLYVYQLILIYALPLFRLCKVNQFKLFLSPQSPAHSGVQRCRVHSALESDRRWPWVHLPDLPSWSLPPCAVSSGRPASFSSCQSCSRILRVTQVKTWLVNKDNDHTSVLRYLI